jgi:hypothetical protein
MVSYDWAEDGPDMLDEDAAGVVHGAVSWRDAVEERAWAGFLAGSAVAGFTGYPLVGLGAFTAAVVFAAVSILKRELRKDQI